MKFLPFERIALKTELTEEEIIDRLSDYIEPDYSFSFKVFSYEEPEKSYEGKINNGEFRIRRIAFQRGNIPVIIGTLENNFDNVTINLTIRPPISHVVGVCLVYILFGFRILPNFLKDPLGFIPLIFLGIILLGYIITISFFNAESAKAKIDLMKLLEAREV